MAHFVVEAAQDLLAAIELRHLGAEAVEDRRELARDVAAADDDEATREALEVEDFVRADRAFATAHVGWHRPAAGGDDDALGRVAHAADLDLMRADDARASAQDRDPGADEQLAVDAVQARDLLGAVGLQRRPVEGRPGNAPAEAVRFLEALGVVGGEAVELLRDAAEVDAGAAERGVFGDGDTRAAHGGHARGADAAAARADDEEIECGLAHAGCRPSFT